MVHSQEVFMANAQEKIVDYKGYLLTASARRGRLGMWFSMVAIERNTDVQCELLAPTAATRELAVEGAISYGKQIVDGDRGGLRV